MGRVSPGMAGGAVLISSMSRVRARVTRREAGRWRVTVMASGVYAMGAGQAANDGFAGDGAVFVVVVQVGVEVA